MYNKKLLLITTPGDPKNSELRSTIKFVLEQLDESDSVEYKEVDATKHPNIGKKLGIKMQAQFQIKDQKRVEDDPLLVVPSLVILEDNVPVFQKAGTIKPQILLAALTTKKIYANPDDDVVPVNPFY